MYHVMARADRREDIVLDDTDRRRFEQTLSEAVEHSGWVLMCDHYHALVQSPEANRGPGMRWLQNTRTLTSATLTTSCLHSV